MRTEKLKKSKGVFSYSLNNTAGQRSGIFFYLVYIFCCAIFSLWINLGSAGLNAAERMANKRFIPVWIGTILLLLLYAILIKYIHTALVIRRRFTGNAKLNFIIYILYSLCIVLAIHGLILEVLLPDKPGLILFSYAYLTTDFWFFFPIVIDYILFIHWFPGWALLQFPLFGQIKIHKLISEPVARPTEVLLLTAGVQSGEHQAADESQNTVVQLDESLMEPPLEDIAQTTVGFSHQNETASQDTLLDLWKRDRDRPALMVYLLRKWEIEELLDSTTIKCLHAVIIYKEQRTADVYMHDGKFCRIDVTTKELQENPWLVKIRARVYVNMLYFRVPVNRPNKLEINTEIKEKLERWLPEDKLKMLITPSRDLSKNLKDFWGILKSLDETKLEKEFNLA